MWKRALEQFVDKHTAAFDSEDEHKHQHWDIFVEYKDMVDYSLGLFLKKQKCDEDALAVRPWEVPPNSALE